jgi:hypothetical protein
MRGILLCDQPVLIYTRLSRNLYVTNNEVSIQEFGTSMERAARINYAFIIGAGDFNLPGWNWKV